jgi:hypothetical protein
MVLVANWPPSTADKEKSVRKQAFTMRNIEPVIAKARAERRKFRRVRVNLPGKLFLPDSGQEMNCTVLDMSPGGAQIICDEALQKGDRFVLYIDGFGRFEGVIVRVEADGYGMHFASTPLKRERTAEQLILFVNRNLVDEKALRRNDRTPTRGITRFTRHDGTIVPCEVIDLSLSGISLKTDARPPIGEFVLIGQLAGRVARHHPDGIGVEFIGAPCSNTDALHAQLALPR